MILFWTINTYVLAIIAGFLLGFGVDLFHRERKLHRSFWSPSRLVEIAVVFFGVIALFKLGNESARQFDCVIIFACIGHSVFCFMEARRLKRREEDFTRWTSRNKEEWPEFAHYDADLQNLKRVPLQEQMDQVMGGNDGTYRPNPNAELKLGQAQDLLA